MLGVRRLSRQALSKKPTTDLSIQLPRRDWLVLRGPGVELLRALRPTERIDVRHRVERISVRAWGGRVPVIRASSEAADLSFSWLEHPRHGGVDAIHCVAPSR